LYKNHKHFDEEYSLIGVTDLELESAARFGGFGGIGGGIFVVAPVVGVPEHEESEDEEPPPLPALIRLIGFVGVCWSFCCCDSDSLKI
jgi:hypothetical protein